MIKSSTQVTITYNEELRGYKLEPSATAIEKDLDNNLTPSEIEWRSYYGSAPFYDGILSVFETTNGTGWEEITLSASQIGQGYCKYTPTNTAIAVRCILKDSAGAVVLDINTVPILHKDIEIESLLDNAELSDAAKIEALKKLLSINAQRISSHNSQISNLDGNIQSNAEEIDKFISEYGSIISGYTGVLNIGADRIQAAVSKYENIVVFDDGKQKEFLQSIATFFSVESDGLYIQKEENGVKSPFNIFIDNQTIKFRDNEADIAYISNRQLFIPDAVTDRLAIGNSANGFYIWQVEKNGSLTLKRRRKNT